MNQHFQRNIEKQLSLWNYNHTQMCDYGKWSSSRSLTVINVLTMAIRRSYASGAHMYFWKTILLLRLLCYWISQTSSDNGKTPGITFFIVIGDDIDYQKTLQHLYICELHILLYVIRLIHQIIFNYWRNEFMSSFKFLKFCPGDLEIPIYEPSIH